MRLTFLIGVIYLAILKAANPGHRSAPRAPASRTQYAGIVWGSLVPRGGDQS